ncbi:MAG: phosphate/phosphite/phosphonate ABC transporter substrate-binding protein [Deltaproteobacteria bacterium]|nr:phosphate/phosphite/phosphonate ABC transporter substrate-binding protein [Deltaproteobacteria bacterium]
MTSWAASTTHATLLLALISGCGPTTAPYLLDYGPPPPSDTVEVVLGVHPLHNPKHLHEVFGPLTDYLTDAIPNTRFRLEASRSYAAFDEKLYAGRFDFALPNPYQTVRSLSRGYSVFGKMANDEDFRGIILVRRDSGIREVSDLRGAAIAYPAPTALAATMMPQLFLQEHGLRVMEEAEVRYVGSQESSMLSVFLGETAAAATWPPPWRALCKERPEVAEALEVRWETESLPNNGLVVRDDVPAALTRRVATALFDLHNHPEGRAILERMELSRFEPATDATYAPVRSFLDHFNDTVRQIER